MPIRALLFDLDDTLLETHHAHREAMLAACRSASDAHPHWTAEQFVEAFTQAYREIERQLEAGTLQLTSNMSFRTRTWEETLRACDLLPDLAEHLARVYLVERRKRYRLYDDVPAALDELAKEYRLVIVTNGLGELQREKIAAVRLERWFPHAAVSGELGSWKPDPGIFRHALEMAETRPEEAVMIGDALERDVRGAQALGIRTIWMRRYAHLEPIAGIEPDACLEDMSALGPLLRQA
jgi:putative hydrolase of the HAD superfamily